MSVNLVFLFSGSLSAQSFSWIDGEETGYEMNPEIYSVEGHLISAYHQVNNIAIRDLVPGVYHLRIQHIDGTITSRKIIKL